MPRTAPGELTPKQARFCQEYVKDLNGSAAAVRAGYSSAAAKEQASRLLTKTNVSAKIARLAEKRTQKADISAGRVLEELRRIAFLDPRELFEPDGTFKSMHNLSDEVAAAVIPTDVLLAGGATQRNLVAGDGVTDRVARLKLVDKAKALETLAKYHGLLEKRVQVEGNITIGWQQEGFGPSPSAEGSGVLRVSGSVD